MKQNLRTQPRPLISGGRRRTIEKPLWACVGLLVCGCPTLGGQSLVPAQTDHSPTAFERSAQDHNQSGDPQASGHISGRVVDRTDVAAVGAAVRLTSADQSLDQQMLTGEDGEFSFANVAAGPFRLSISSAGFATQTVTGTLHPGEGYVVPQIVLPIATAVTEIRVVPSPVEMAQEQLRQEEKQRALGFIPNFYVSYVPNAAPLTSKQKFTLAGKILVDPVTFGLTGVVAGIQQGTNDFSAYGQGAQGYAKRYGAAYADMATGTLIGSAILPSLLKQDPRYFYKGSGSKRSRLLYAVANSVLCKGDNGHWQANYSAMLGTLAASGISNLYYPANDRGAGLTIENTLIGIGATAAANVFQEFVVRKFTPNAPKPDPVQP